MTIAAGPDFRPDEAQETIVRLAGEVLDGSPDHPWKALGQAGLLTLAVPAGLGGEGLGPAATALLLIEIGRRAVAGPALSTLAMGVPIVARWGSADQRRDLLDGVGEGRVLTAALAEPGDPMPDLPATTATGDWRVTGIKIGVPDAERAHRILVPVLAAAGGTAVVVVDPASPGVCLRNGTLRLDAVESEPLGSSPLSYDDLRNMGILGACALGDGALAGALAMTARHIATREQFGRRLATFQAVAQQIADVYITARTLHLTVLAAAWRLGGDDVAVAAQWFAAEALPAVRTCHHLHGGLGLTADYPLHRHTAMIRDLVRFLGGSEHCLRRLGGRLVHRPD